MAKNCLPKNFQSSREIWTLCECMYFRNAPKKNKNFRDTWKMSGCRRPRRRNEGGRVREAFPGVPMPWFWRQQNIIQEYPCAGVPSRFRIFIFIYVACFFGLVWKKQTQKQLGNKNVFHVRAILKKGLHRSHSFENKVCVVYERFPWKIWSVGKNDCWGIV